MKYQNEFTREISFPIGGIGTGSVGLGGNGRLMDFEIFNRPSKGSINRFSHFAIKAIVNNKPITYILNSDLEKDYMGQYSSKIFAGYGFGPNDHTMCGFPHFKSLTFNGEFPIANLNFSDDKFPASIKMTAFNPFIPNDADNSSIPAAFFEFEVENTYTETLEYQIAFSFTNPYAVSKNYTIKANGITGVTLVNAGAEQNDKQYGELTIASDCEKCNVQTYWYRGKWKDGVVTFWNEFNNTGYINDRKYDENGINDTATITASITAEPGKKSKARFVLSWNIPNNYNYWDEYKDEKGNDVTWKNYYAVLFKNSEASAEYSLKNWKSLYERTLKFKNTLYNSSLPTEAIEAAAANLSVLKSPTVLRLEDGTFYGWEGVHEDAGSCEGTCQHVWNYAYAMCFLFPELERSIRNAEFKYSTADDGRMCFRMKLPLGREMGDFRACLDGQMGSIIKLYREWKLSGDNQWLEDNWNNIKKILEYAWSDKNPDKWDFNKDGILEGRQHHTLDMEMFGPSSWLEGMYLAALKAAAEMGEFLGDNEKATEYKELFEKGKKWTKENLFNGKYFIQKINLNDKSITDEFDASDDYWNDEKNQIKYQIGEGSSIDQLLAQWHADIIGLGDIFDSEQTDIALSEMMKNNYKPCMRDFINPWRIFSLNDEAGSVICVYPENSSKPFIPIPYCEETMTGFEYSFAGLLCSRNKVDDGIRVVNSVRNRFDGKKRNPWNEFECGSNYARSMASYALIPILSGFEFDLPHNHIGFNPYKKGDFSTIWSVDGAWGSFEISKNKICLSVIEGCISLSSFGIGFVDTISALSIDNTDIPYHFNNGIIEFEKIQIHSSLEITVD